MTLGCNWHTAPQRGRNQPYLVAAVPRTGILSLSFWSRANSEAVRLAVLPDSTVSAAVVEIESAARRHARLDGRQRAPRKAADDDESTAVLQHGGPPSNSLPVLHADHTKPKKSITVIRHYYLYVLQTYPDSALALLSSQVSNCCCCTRSILSLFYFIS